MSYGPSPKLSVSLPPRARAAAERLAGAFGLSVQDLLRHLVVQLETRPHFVRAHLLSGEAAPKPRRS